jgi:hypothetical protein
MTQISVYREKRSTIVCRRTVKFSLPLPEWQQH